MNQIRKFLKQHKKAIIKIIEILIISFSAKIQSYVVFNNLSFFLLLFLLIFLFKIEKKNNSLIITLSIIFALFQTFGNQEGYKIFTTSHPSTIFIIFYYLVSIFGWGLLFNQILKIVFDKLDSINITTKKNKQVSPIKFILLFTIIGFVCYIPYFLKYYPGIITSDTIDQFTQILGQKAFNNHHPFLHSLIMRLFYSIGYGIFGTVNEGIATYAIFQMLLLSFSYAYALYTLYNNNVNKVLLVIAFILFYLNPINAVFSISLVKDTIFSAITLIFIVFMYNRLKNNDWCIKKYIVFCIIVFLFCFLRSNGLYAYLMFILFIIIFNRKLFKKLLISIIITILLIFGFKFTMAILDVNQPDFVESLSIPLQQIAYTVVNDGNISKKEKQQLNKIMDVDNLSSIYQTDVSDPIKNNIRAKDTNLYLEKHKRDYLKIWLSIGVKNPNLYLQSYAYQTNGYWYHYPGQYIVYEDGIYNQIGVKKVQLLPRLINNLLYSYQNLFYKLYLRFWSIGLNVYVLLIMLVYSVKKRKNYLIYIPVLGIWLTLLIATPVSCSFRYAYPLFTSIIFLVFIMLSEKNYNTN